MLETILMAIVSLLALAFLCLWLNARDEAKWHVDLYKHYILVNREIARGFIRDKSKEGTKAFRDYIKRQNP
jgi:hypothetical protein